VKRYTKLLTLAGLVASAMMLSGQALAAKLTMNIGFSVTEAHPYGTFMNLFAERFETLSGGTVRVKVHSAIRWEASRNSLRSSNWAPLMVR